MEFIREAAVAGQFYPEDKYELENSILEYMQGTKRTVERSYGIIVPHAGYEYSGKTAAYSYKAISRSKFDTFIIIGTNHSSSETCISLKDFKTPLGIVESDREFCKELKDLKIKVDEKEQAFEHSIEVQLPFLQTNFKNFKIVPIAASFSNYEECKKFSEKIVNIVKKTKRKVCIIASGDFTHYGESYGYTPFAPATRSKLYVIDKKAIDFLTELKAKEFLEYSKDTTICGISSMAASVEICRLLGARKADLLNYSNSGDLSNDYENCVSYASMIIY